MCDDLPLFISQFEYKTNREVDYPAVSSGYDRRRTRARGGGGGTEKKKHGARCESFTPRIT